jgi:hypothetical protein
MDAELGLPGSGRRENYKGLESLKPCCPRAFDDEAGPRSHAQLRFRAAVSSVGKVYSLMSIALLTYWNIFVARKLPIHLTNRKRREHGIMSITSILMMLSALIASCGTAFAGVVSVPEPGTLAVLGAALGGFAAVRYFTRK